MDIKFSSTRQDVPSFEGNDQRMSIWVPLRESIYLMHAHLADGIDCSDDLNVSYLRVLRASIDEILEKYESPLRHRIVEAQPQYTKRDDDFFSF